ncbi:hypothetical protein SAMN05421805_12782 [Saccharopolyspora antimicrobica]|uniref:MerR HTH family regulatory protein n=1 Tax=Saccharopolyspora antimicrobica TaxID=455193 RepID=A0A1I5KMP8_9PSEU|nr:hypothetical protein [Saccharopolyspora antimicrobica]RKT85615.1 hypothetical protein ATL45_3962 [Saccharopolyspora antimicrobica]SFO86187.1 hypothetical protein SAMN05421805_12782 [Saccharopolyspora antimicrobica]
MTRPPIVRYRDGRTLLDRASLARLSGRSVHTIRGACPVADRDRSTGRPLYDAQQCAQILAAIPTRQSGTRSHLTAPATSA